MSSADNIERIGKKHRGTCGRRRKGEMAYWIPCFECGCNRQAYQQRSRQGLYQGEASAQSLDCNSQAHAEASPINTSDVSQCACRTRPLALNRRDDDSKSEKPLKVTISWSMPNTRFVGLRQWRFSYSTI